MGKKNTKSNQKDCGVIYVAFGVPYLLQALHSYRTLKMNNPDISAKIVTNVLSFTSDDPLLTVQYIDAPDGENRKYKTSVYELSPFQRTLYLDADTEVCDNISFGFHFLDRVDFAIRPAPVLIKNVSFEINPERSYRWARKWGEFNGGVFFFRKCSECEILFKSWNAEIIEKKLKRDQKALTRAIVKNPGMSLWPLAPAWNFTRYDYKIHRKQKKLRREPFIWHYIDYSYSPRSLYNVLRMAGGNYVFRQKAYSYSFWKKFVIAPYLKKASFGNETLFKMATNLFRPLRIISYFGEGKKGAMSK